MMRTIPHIAFYLALLTAVGTADAASFVKILEIQKVTENVYALVGPKEQRDVGNLANNATFGVVVTNEGVVLMDPGGSWKGAQAIHEAIKSITDKPVKFVVDTGGQDHRWLGNAYWAAQGATIIASEDAVADHKERGSLQLTALKNFLGKQMEGTEPVYADVKFEDGYTFELGGIEFQIKHPGQAHTPGDSFVWVPSKKAVFTGDIVYVERILGVGSQSNAKSWIAAFEAMAALLPEHVVPGHGHATTLEKAKADTYAYLINLREKIAKHIDAGGDMIGSVEIDQSDFSYLDQFESLAKRNAQQVYSEMEWE
ncbi:MBL fold metallo-hydrolase [Hoeflea alexandrii]|uniref:MBL fold metallo-hydrolase n=1 Tax=Hoeflea alexandrii TaxID=288436 RepID=UPI0022AE721F|nr:MBL fold metallo-hydrolase [Hoeflea alexandrii]MCZ4287259.1 MBL fold metallo-hydrolase [Hoeflea alexandrii]